MVCVVGNPKPSEFCLFNKYKYSKCEVRIHLPESTLMGKNQILFYAALLIK